MKRTNHTIEREIARAVEEITPDALPQILLRLSRQKGENNDMTYAAEQIAAPLPFTREKEQKKAAARPWRRWYAAAAAMLVLVLGAGVGYGYYTPQASIGFDVNPSIEITVNRADKVLRANPLNEDAKIVLGDMDLKNVDLDVAVNALIGSIIKNGYISELKNSILISVDSSDAKKEKELQERVASEVNALLGAYSVEGAVLSQAVSKDESVQALADEYDISPGKASLVSQLVSQDDTLQVADVAALNINDINLLIDSKQPTLTGVTTSGQASAGAYIGEAKAKEIALAHAGVAEADTTYLRVEMDYDDGRMEYEVDFYADGMEYEYEIDATTGKIRDYERERKRAPQSGGAGNAGETGAADNATGGANGSGSRDSGTGGTGGSDTSNESGSGAGSADAGKQSYIGSSKAKSIALGHAGVSASSVRDLDVDLDRENGRMVYEVEFEHNGLEYDYEIDAYTGEILWWKSERD